MLKSLSAVGQASPTSKMTSKGAQGISTRVLQWTMGAVLCAQCGCAPVPPMAPPTAERSEKVDRTEFVAANQAVPVSKTDLSASDLKQGDLQGDPLRERLELAIEQVRQRQILTTNGFWTVFHGILGLGPGLSLKDPRSGNYVNALDYVLDGQFQYGPIRGMRFIPTRDGLDVQMGPTFVGQGHQDQFIAEIGEWNVPADRKVVVFGKDYTIMDFVHESQARARVGVGQELSWTLVVVSQYVGTDAEWTNRHGEKLTFLDILRDELDASVNQAACGGTHRLYGLTWALHAHLARGGKQEGIWQEVADKLDEYKKLAHDYQNPDGSLSSNYFRGPGSTTNLQERLGSSGHILEWLAVWMTKSELEEPWVKDAAHSVAMTILDIQSDPMESGALYHATHGLVTYYHRVYGWEKFKNQANNR